MGNSPSNQRQVVKHKETQAQLAITRGNAKADVSTNGSEAAARASGAKGSGKAYTSGRTYYAEAKGSGKAIATDGGAAAMAGRDNHGVAYRSQKNSSSSNYLNNDLELDRTVLKAGSYAAVQGNGTAGYSRDTGRAGVAVHGRSGKASVKRDGEDVTVYYDGKGTAGADDQGMWAKVGDNVARVQFDEDEPCTCGKRECTCRVMLC